MSSEVRFGNVSSIDYEAGKCEVTYPDRDDTGNGAVSVQW